VVQLVSLALRSGGFRGGTGWQKGNRKNKKTSEAFERDTTRKITRKERFYTSGGIDESENAGGSAGRRAAEL